MLWQILVEKYGFEASYSEASELAEQIIACELEGYATDKRLLEGLLSAILAMRRNVNFKGKNSAQPRQWIVVVLRYVQPYFDKNKTNPVPASNSWILKILKEREDLMDVLFFGDRTEVEAALKDPERSYPKRSISDDTKKQMRLVSKRKNLKRSLKDWVKVGLEANTKAFKGLKFELINQALSGEVHLKRMLAFDSPDDKDELRLRRFVDVFVAAELKQEAILIQSVLTSFLCMKQKDIHNTDPYPIVSYSLACLMIVAIFIGSQVLIFMNLVVICVLISILVVIAIQQSYWYKRKANEHANILNEARAIGAAHLEVKNIDVQK